MLEAENTQRDWEPDPDWMTLSPESEAKCRRRVGGQHAYCRARAVAQLKRGAIWWVYCADHLYGREIHDGVVMVRRYRSE